MMHLQNALARLRQSGTASQYLIVTEVQLEAQRLADAYDRVKKTLKETQDAAQQVLQALENRINGMCPSAFEQKAITALREALNHSADADKMVLDDPHPPHRLCECTACLEYWTPKPTCDHVAGGGKVILTAEAAQQIENAFSFAESQADYPPDDLMLYHEALYTIRAARAQEPTDCQCCGAKGTVIPSAFCRECKSDFWPPSVPVQSGHAAKPKIMEGFDRSKYTPEQWEWCVKYENRTGFDPMMEDFEAGIKTFYEAAQHACAWYDDHTGDAHNAVTRNIPGDPIEG